MESFFLAETTKYLYLLFDENNFIHQEVLQPFKHKFEKKYASSENNSVNKTSENQSGKINREDLDSCFIGSSGYIFNTEAHPIDIAAIKCCSNDFVKKYERSRRTFTNKDGCKRRPFHQKFFTSGNFVDDSDIFQNYPKTKPP